MNRRFARPCSEVLNGSNAVILREDLNNGYCNYTFAKTNIIREIKALGPSPTRSPDALPSRCAVRRVSWVAS